MQALKTKRSIADIIGDIVNESLKTAKKNSKSSRLSEGGDLFDDKSTEDKSSSSDPASEEEKKLTGTSDKSAKINDEEEAEKLKSGDITSDDVIEKLNSIRAGKSFKEEEIKNKMEEYVKGLDKAEKSALLTFLKALSQIVTGEIKAANVIKPSDNPAEVKMEKEPAVKRRTIKPVVIKMNPVKDDGEKKTPAEDTKGPVPITAKKK
jgi:hypothetical protein